MEQRMSLVTLGVADLARARRFYEDGLGWRRGNTQEGVAFYQLGGVILALFGREELARDAGIKPDGAGFTGFALAYNTRSRGEVSEILDEAVAAGGTLVKQPQDTFWGGHAAYFADPDGHLWEIAWNPFWTVGADGATKLL